MTLMQSNITAAKPQASVDATTIRSLLDQVDALDKALSAVADNDLDELSEMLIQREFRILEQLPSHEIRDQADAARAIEHLMEEYQTAHCPISSLSDKANFHLLGSLLAYVQRNS